MPAPLRQPGYSSAASFFRTPLSDAASIYGRSALRMFIFRFPLISAHAVFSFLAFEPFFAALYSELMLFAPFYFSLSMPPLGYERRQPPPPDHPPMAAAAAAAAEPLYAAAAAAALMPPFFTPLILIRDYGRYAPDDRQPLLPFSLALPPPPAAIFAAIRFIFRDAIFSPYASPPPMYSPPPPRYFSSFSDAASQSRLPTVCALTPRVASPRAPAA